VKTRDFAAPVQARVEASRCGFSQRHRRDGLEVWMRDDGTEIALQRERRPRSTVWHWTKEFPTDRGEIK
jgi:hypothetical protein